MDLNVKAFINGELEIVKQCNSSLEQLESRASEVWKTNSSYSFSYDIENGSFDVVYDLKKKVFFEVLTIYKITSLELGIIISSAAQFQKAFVSVDEYVVFGLGSVSVHIIMNDLGQIEMIKAILHASEKSKSFIEKNYDFLEVESLIMVLKNEKRRLDSQNK